MLFVPTSPLGGARGSSCVPYADNVHCPAHACGLAPTNTYTYPAGVRGRAMEAAARAAETCHEGAFLQGIEARSAFH